MTVLFCPRTKALVLELLAAVCLVRGGHEIILAAFDNFKEVWGSGGCRSKLGWGGTGGTTIRLGLGTRTQGMEEWGTPGPGWDGDSGTQEDQAR